MMSAKIAVKIATYLICWPVAYIVFRLAFSFGGLFDERVFEHNWLVFFSVSLIAYILWRNWVKIVEPK